MDLSSMLSLIQTAAELGLISSLTVLSLFLSYSMLNVCDLSTDGCFTLGAAVGSMVAISGQGHPFLSIPIAMLAGVLSGFITAFLQTKMGIDSLLSGIIVNTGLYSINIAVMKNNSLVNLAGKETVFTKVKTLLSGTPFEAQNKLIVAAVILVVLFLALFLKTNLGLAIRATGNNPDMVRSSSINTAKITIIGLSISNAITALSGCLLAQSQKSANIDIGTGMVTIALASLLIGGILFSKRKSISVRAVCSVFGALIFRFVYTAALRFNMPAYMLKLVSSVIVIIAISAPYLKTKIPMLKRRMELRSKKEVLQ